MEMHKHGYGTRRTLSKPTILVLLSIGAFAWTGVAAQPTDAPPRPAGPPDEPPAEQVALRNWGLLALDDRGFESALDNAPLAFWIEAVRASAREYDRIDRLTREQDEILSRIETGRARILHGRPRVADMGTRRDLRRLIGDLHANQQEIERCETRVDEVAAAVAGRAPEIRQRLESVLGMWDAVSTGSAVVARPRREMARQGLQWSVDLMREAEEEPDGAADRIAEALRQTSELREARHMNRPGFQRISERIDELEREQALLKQRIEAGQRELEEIRAQIDRMSQMQQWRTQRGAGLGPGAGGAGPPAGRDRMGLGPGRGMRLYEAPPEPTPAPTGP
ncbi:hypothetical protein JW916_01285 [Candidatus Sumerlaeota bacterium]|nr:hypothetical protein [Candidatus Sumerlaeota bacterium]